MKKYLLGILCCLPLSLFAAEYNPNNFTAKQKDIAISKLTSIQKYVTQDNGTERSGSGEFYNNFKKGIYVDVVSGQPLFSSSDKYQADTGWPAFTKPITSNAIKIVKTHGWFGEKYEVQSSLAKSHLGDKFSDRYITNPPSDGKVTESNISKPLPRYCIDSAALRFIPLDKMKKDGYSKYIKYVK
ncbi:peptide-methionine (R)-S-oxide reductase [Francisella halioticida]|uniref:peptide-methionine (R)-S-oxide reductase n=1 Tax=Francisella halioticida TaxID=549298 RepID=A0ABM6M0P7_9GAMM|nr:peptide-methionine (R)-S-oxide reductase MsrB [Francisella halioticida]ASG68492.1 peptide-methionine (R)-S-oxide reductase [Francisella halioticida]BCD91381.1 peptide-methionine (R)-S-oxide reductase [Francisella halioticida]